MAVIDPVTQHKVESRLRDLSDQAQRNPGMTAALVGGAAVATAGAIWGARAYARRGTEDKPLNAVMQNAVTATELAHSRGLARPPFGTAAGAEPRPEREPSVPHEPAVPVT